MKSISIMNHDINLSAEFAVVTTSGNNSITKMFFITPATGEYALPGINGELLEDPELGLPTSLPDGVTCPANPYFETARNGNLECGEYDCPVRTIARSSAAQTVICRHITLPELMDRQLPNRMLKEVQRVRGKSTLMQSAINRICPSIEGVEQTTNRVIFPSDGDLDFNSALRPVTYIHHELNQLHKGHAPCKIDSKPEIFKPSLRRGKLVCGLDECFFGQGMRRVGIRTANCVFAPTRVTDQEIIQIFVQESITEV